MKKIKNKFRILGIFIVLLLSFSLVSALSIQKSASKNILSMHESFILNLKLTNPSGESAIVQINEPVGDLEFLDFDSLNNPDLGPNTSFYAPPYLRFIREVPANGELVIPLSVRSEYLGDIFIPETTVNFNTEFIVSNSLNLRVVCNQNYICEPYLQEDYETCPLDCPSGSSDYVCDMKKDSIVDPDCVPEADPDYVPATCFNGVQDILELGIDCGPVCNWDCENRPMKKDNYTLQNRGESKLLDSLGCLDYDSDFYDKYFYNSIVTYNGQDYTDSCSDSNTLVEYSCGPGSFWDAILNIFTDVKLVPKSDEVNCQYGCSNGACNSAPLNFSEGEENQTNINQTENDTQNLLKDVCEKTNGCSWNGTACYASQNAIDSCLVNVDKNDCISQGCSWSKPECNRELFCLNVGLVDKSSCMPSTTSCLWDNANSLCKDANSNINCGALTTESNCRSDASQECLWGSVCKFNDVCSEINLIKDLPSEPEGLG